MSGRTIRHALKYASACVLCTASLLSLPSRADAKPPIVIRGIPGSPASTELRLAYLASFPNGSLEPSLDKLNAGAMFPGDPLIPDSNPTAYVVANQFKTFDWRARGTKPHHLGGGHEALLTEALAILDDICGISAAKAS